MLGSSPLGLVHAKDVHALAGPIGEGRGRSCEVGLPKGLLSMLHLKGYRIACEKSGGVESRCLSRIRGRRNSERSIHASVAANSDNAVELVVPQSNE